MISHWASELICYKLVTGCAVPIEHVFIDCATQFPAAQIVLEIALKPVRWRPRGGAGRCRSGERFLGLKYALIGIQKLEIIKCNVALVITPFSGHELDLKLTIAPLFQRQW